jgi:hypothetical protein
MTDNPEIQQAENPAIQTSDNPESQKAAKSTPAGRTPRGDAQVLLDTVVALLSTKTITAAAAKLGIDRGTVYDRIDRYNIRDYLDAMPKAALEALQGSSVLAASNLIDDLSARNPYLRQNASKYVLDKALPDPKVQVNIQNNSYSVSDLAGAIAKRREERTQQPTPDMTQMKGGE